MLGIVRFIHWSMGLAAAVLCLAFMFLAGMDPFFWPIILALALSLLPSVFWMSLNRPLVDAFFRANEKASEGSQFGFPRNRIFDPERGLFGSLYGGVELAVLRLILFVEFLVFMFVSPKYGEPSHEIIVSGVGFVHAAFLSIINFARSSLVK